MAHGGDSGPRSRHDSVGQTGRAARASITDRGDREVAVVQHLLDDRLLDRRCRVVFAEHPTRGRRTSPELTGNARSAPSRSVGVLSSPTTRHASDAGAMGARCWCLVAFPGRGRAWFASAWHLLARASARFVKFAVP